MLAAASKYRAIQAMGFHYLERCQAIKKGKGKFFYQFLVGISNRTSFSSKGFKNIFYPYPVKMKLLRYIFQWLQDSGSYAHAPQSITKCPIYYLPNMFNMFS